MQDLAIAYVHNRMQTLPDQTLQSAVDVFHGCLFSPSSASSLNSMVEHLRKESQYPVAIVPEDQRSWELRVREAIADIITPDAIGWMDEGLEAGSDVVANRALQAIEARFQTPLAASSAESRIELIGRLSALMTMIQRQLHAPDSKESSEPTGRPFLLPVLAALSRLLDDSDQQVTSAVYSEAYRLLSLIIQYDDMQWSPAARERLAFILQPGLSNTNRSVRLTAG
jgi:hypothetical protein